MSLAALFDQRVNEPSDIHEHLQYFVDTCVELDAQKVIELGQHRGNSTVGWLYGVEQTGGHVWSVDPEPRAGQLSDRLTTIVGDDLDPAVLEQLPALADVVFVDTNHHYRHTLHELFTYASRVRPGGRILLHDTELRTPFMDPDEREHPFPVKQAVTKFCEAAGLSWSNRTNCYGLATIQIPG